MAGRGAEEKRQRILDAAGQVLLKHGLRGATMAAIAMAAGIAKPTLYAYFPDKEAVFGALIGRLTQTWREAFLLALHAEGGVVERIAAALTAKHKAAFKLLEGSPHAAELYGEHDRLGAGEFAALDAEIAAAIEAELAKAGVARARGLTQLLLAASYGIGRKAKAAAELGPALRLLTERLIGPEVDLASPSPLRGG